MDIKVGETVTTVDDKHGKVVSFMNRIVGIQLKSGEVIYRYTKQIVKLY